jgi:hypothetical protein
MLKYAANSKGELISLLIALSFMQIKAVYKGDRLLEIANTNWEGRKQVIPPN